MIESPEYWKIKAEQYAEILCKYEVLIKYNYFLSTEEESIINDAVHLHETGDTV